MLEGYDHNPEFKNLDAADGLWDFEGVLFKREKTAIFGQWPGDEVRCLSLVIAGMKNHWKRWVFHIESLKSIGNDFSTWVLQRLLTLEDTELTESKKFDAPLLEGWRKT